tara:strand:- start:179 stop:403 length:225 start_codon:yes stop_codon:yes gene_type:complete
MSEDTPEEVTPEEIATHYRSAMDSVNLVNDLKALPSLTKEQTVRLKANVDHLEIMLSRDYWTDEDLTPFTDAVG